MRLWANAMQHRVCHAFGSAVAETPKLKSVLSILRLHKLILFTLTTLFNMQDLPLQLWYWLMLM